MGGDDGILCAQRVDRSVRASRMALAKQYSTRCQNCRHGDFLCVSRFFSLLLAVVALSVRSVGCTTDRRTLLTYFPESRWWRGQTQNRMCVGSTLCLRSTAQYRNVGRMDGHKNGEWKIRRKKNKVCSKFVGLHVHDNKQHTMSYGGDCVVSSSGWHYSVVPKAGLNKLYNIFDFSIQFTVTGATFHYYIEYLIFYST